MKPLFSIVVAILVFAANAHPENIEDVKELPQTKEPIVEAEASEPQTRTERCTACSNTLNLKSPKEILAAIKSLPTSEVHTQETYEGCSSAKGCAGLKVKDGKVVQKFGNLQAFQAAANADTGNEFQFQAAGNSVFEGGAQNGAGPFWWMNQNSPFKTGAGSGSFEKFSKSSSSFTSTSNGGAGGVDLSANPFLNGDLAKFGAGFTGAGGNFAGSQSFESSSASKEIDISKNPFLNGGIQTGFGGQSAFGSGSQSNFGSSAQNGFAANSQSGSGAQGSFGGSQTGLGAAQGSQTGFGAQSGQSSFNAFNSANKFGSTGYTGSSPSPFAPSTGSGVNLVQNSQKNEYDFEQQQQTQQNIDEIFQSTGNVQAHDNSGGSLQQTCAGQGYICVVKSQCNNGVVNTNGGALLQANTQKQYCNTRTEICCRLETSSLAGAGNLQGSLGVGSATFQGASNQGSSLFGQSGSSQNSFGASGFGAGQSTNTAFNANRATTGFGSSQFGAGSSFGSNKFGSTASGIGSTVAPTPGRFGSTAGFNNEVFKSTSQSNFVETDSFSAGSENAGVYRPGASGSGLKPGIPYLPPVDSSTIGSNVISTAYTPSFVTTPRPFSTPRPVTTPRPFSTPKAPTYLPPVSTKAPEYLPPIDRITGSDSFPEPSYSVGGLILDETRTTARPQQPRVPVNVDVPAGCAAALKCTPIEFCTAEGVISNTTVALTRDQEAYRVPLTDCKDLESGRIGKCCRDPLYTDPWPTNQLGKWVPGVFGGNDGKYVGDSRGSPNTQPGGVTVRPPVTGSVYLNNFLTTPKPTLPLGPNQVTPGFPSSTPAPSFVQKNQFGQGSYTQGGRGSYTKGGQGSYSQGGQGSYSQGGQGSYTQGGQGQVAVQGQGQFGSAGQGNQGAAGQFAQGSTYSQTTSGFGQGQNTGVGQTVTQGQGAYGQSGRGQVGVVGQGTQVTQGQGFGISQGTGQVISQGAGQVIRQGAGIGVSRGQGFGVSQGGQSVSQERGTAVTQGFGTGIRREQGSSVTQGSGFGVSQGQGVGVNQGQGFGVSQGQGFGVTQGQGSAVSQGQGFGVSQGQGSVVSQGQGFGVSQGQGSAFSQGQGFGVTQGQGIGVSQGQGSAISQGQGFGVSQGQGSVVSQGQGFGVSQGQGSAVSQGQGFGVSRGQGFAVTGGQGQYGSQGQGQIVSQGQGQIVSQGQGSLVSRGQGSGVRQGSGFGVSQGAGFGVSQGSGFGVSQGGGAGISQGGGLGVSQGGGRGVSQGVGFGVSQGSGQGFQQGLGFGVSQGQGQTFLQGQGQKLIQGQGEEITQGIVSGVRRGQGYTVSQNGGFGVENEFGESIQRVYLPRYTGSGDCGVRNPLKPYGNRQDLEVDFAEIPWQAMILLQTNRSLLCGGVITRPDVVITSASCVEGLDAKNVLIKGGEWKLGIDEEPLPFQIVQVKHILRHPAYTVGSYINDVAILVLTENLRLAKNIWPICLPSASDTLDGFYNGAGECIVTGWGKTVLQAHLLGSIMHGLNVSLLNPGECQSKISQDYPHLQEQYEQDSCICGQPTNPANNICKVDIGSALACTTGDNHFVLRGIYSWDSGCQVGNQLATFYRFDLEWYEWAIGLTESVRFSQYTTTKITKNKIISGVKSTFGSSGVKGAITSGSTAGLGAGGFGIKGIGLQGQSQTGEYSRFGSSNFGSGSTKFTGTGGFETDIKGPIQKTFSATFTEKKFYQTEPKIVTYTTKPEIVTFTTKPEYFTFTTKPKIVTYTTKPEIVTYTTKPEIITYTTKPKIVTYTTKPEIITYTTKPQVIKYDYQTSGSQTNSQIVAPSVSFNPSFSEVVGAKHTHDAKCKCL